VSSMTEPMLDRPKRQPSSVQIRVEPAVVERIAAAQGAEGAPATETPGQWLGRRLAALLEAADGGRQHDARLARVEAELARLGGSADATTAQLRTVGQALAQVGQAVGALRAEVQSVRFDVSAVGRVSDDLAALGERIEVLLAAMEARR
jgi:hypothetical protein